MPMPSSPHPPPKAGRASSIRSVLGRVWRHLSRRRRWQLPGLAGLMLLGGLAEAMTLGAILPFLAVIVDPQQALGYPGVQPLFEALGFTASEQLVLPLTLAFALTAIAAGGMRLLVLWCSKNYVQRVGHELSMAVYRRTLYQPYPVHLARNTSELLGSVEKINAVTIALNQSLALTSASVTALAIVLALLAISPAVAGLTFLGFGGCYLLLMAVTRQRLTGNSQIIGRHLNLKIQVLQEGLGGIRDVLLSHSQPYYCDRYRDADWPLCQARANNAFLAASPRYAMEAFGLVLIAAIAYGLSQQPAGAAAALPLLGTVALGAQRLLPSLQQIFAAWAYVRGDQSSVEDVLKLLDQPLPQDSLQAPPPLSWHTALEFVDVGFRYGPAGPWVLRHVSFKILKGARVGLVGATGSGKSTVLNILMGLLEPTEGQVLLDGQPLAGEWRRAWQRTVAHVPQHIYLADTTMAENIALGVPRAAIDLDRVRQAARQAQIDRVIEARPQGYWSVLGERGIRLSGGQQQRLGIARALYRQSTTLVFDEATSALDTATETEVMASVYALSPSLTVVLVAHRLTTLAQCDWIIQLEQGQVRAQGSYAEVVGRSTLLEPLDPPRTIH